MHAPRRNGLPGDHAIRGSFARCSHVGARSASGGTNARNTPKPPSSASCLDAPTADHPRRAQDEECAFALTQVLSAASVPAPHRGWPSSAGRQEGAAADERCVDMVRPLISRDVRRRTRVPYCIRAAVAANVLGCSRHCIRSSARCRCFRFALFARGGGPAQVRQAAATTRGQRPPNSYRHEVKYEAYCRGLRRMSASLRAIPHRPVEVDRHWRRHQRYLALPATGAIALAARHIR